MSTFFIKKFVVSGFSLTKFVVSAGNFVMYAFVIRKFCSLCFLTVEKFVVSTFCDYEIEGVFFYNLKGGLYSAPLIPAGIRSFLRNPVDSGGMNFSRKACYFCHSGA